MRAEGRSRNGKIEKTRFVGIVMMLTGVLALTFAVAGVSGAGTTAALPAHHQCDVGWTHSSPTGQLAGAINKGCNQTTTTKKAPCDCTTSTTLAPVTSTTQCNTTSTSSSTTTSTMPATTTSTELSGETTTTAEVTTTTVEGDTTTTDTSPVTNGFVRPTSSSSPSVVVQGVTSSLPGITVEPAAATGGTLPFTGGSPYPLAGFGLVMLGAGAGLSRRKRRMA